MWISNGPTTRATTNGADRRVCLDGKSLGRVSNHESPHRGAWLDGKSLAGETDQLFGYDPRSEDRNLRNLAARHRHLIAAVEPWAALAIFKDFVRQRGAVFDYAKAMVEEEVRHACEEANAAYAVLLGFAEQCLQQLSPVPLPFASGLTTIERTSAR